MVLLSGLVLVGCASVRAPQSGQVATTTTGAPGVPTTAMRAADPGQVVTPAPIVGPTDRVPAGHPAIPLDPAVQLALSTTEGARVYDTARPGPTVPILRLEGASVQRIQPGETATLQVRSAPGALVSFWAKDGGLFPNQRASITVLADDQGLATTTVFANPGTLYDTSIFIGSPQATGVISTIVQVIPPDDAAVATPTFATSVVATPAVKK